MAICLFMSTFSFAQKNGFAMSSDLKLGYKDKVFSTTLGYDIGYKFKDMLYFGVGPVVGVSTGNDVTAFSAGGYGKVRFTIPLRAEIKPFVQGNCGYVYNFKSEKGGMSYGAGAGVKFKNVLVGVYCDIATNKTTITSTGSYWKETSTRRDFSNPGKNSGSNGKYITYTTTDKKTEWIVTPNFLIGIEF